MDLVSGIQEDIHSIKKLSENFFPLLEKTDTTAGEGEEYQKTRLELIQMLKQLLVKVKEGGLEHLTATPMENATKETIEKLKQETHKLEQQRQRLSVQANASYKGML